MDTLFSVVRYLPDAARNEPINVGILLQAGEQVAVKVNKDALKRVLVADPRADSAAISRLEAFLIKTTQEALINFDFKAGKPVTIPPSDKGFLQALTSQSTDKIVFASPQYVNVPSSKSEDISSVLDSLTARLVKPLRERPNFFPIESPPKKFLRQSFRPWILSGDVHQDYELRGRSGISRVADFYFENGSNFVIKIVDLEMKRESQLLSKAQSTAFEFEDIRRANQGRQWQPMAVCAFAADRPEDMVTEVREIFDVVDCTVFDASQQLSAALDFAREHLPARQ